MRCTHGCALTAGCFGALRSRARDAEKDGWQWPCADDEVRVPSALPVLSMSAGGSFDDFAALFEVTDAVDTVVAIDKVGHAYFDDAN